MASLDIGGSVEAGKTIVVGIIVLAVVAAVGLFIVDKLNEASNGSLQVAVKMVQDAMGPIGGGITFLAVAFIVLVAAFILKVVSSLGK